MNDSSARAFRGTSRLRHRTVAVATATGLGLALALSGCGSVLGGHSAGNTPAPATVTVTPAADSTPTVLPGATDPSSSDSGSTDQGSTDSGTVPTTGPATDAGTAPASTSSTGPDDLGTPVASRNGPLNPGGSARVDVFPLRRSGTTMTATIRVTLLKGTSSSSSGNIASTFNDDNNAQSDSSDYAPDGIKAIDGKHRMAYLVGSDGHGQCICTPRKLLSQILDVGQSITISTTYAAPPSDVTSMGLQIPSFGTIPNVPVQ